MTTIRVKRGPKATMPTTGLKPGQLLFAQDEKELYIANSENEKVLINHKRQHKIDKEADHAPDPENAGRIVMLDEPEGKVILMDIVAYNPPGEVNEPRIIIEKNYETGQLIIDINESAIDHNLLKNFDPMRHKRMEFKPEHKAYFVEP